MKYLLLLSLILFSSYSFALTGTVTCASSEGDGSSVTAVIDTELSSFPTNVQYTIRKSKPKGAELSTYITTQEYVMGFGPIETVKTMILRDPTTKHLVLVITDGNLSDDTGTYPVECKIKFD